MTDKKPAGEEDGREKLISKPTDKKKKSQWNEGMEVCLLRELVVQNPFRHRHGTQERGKVWEQVATALQPLTEAFKTAITLNQRTVRDKYKGLKAKLKHANNKDRAASGISTEETDTQREIRDLLEQLDEMECDAELIPSQKKDEEEKKRLDGVEMQKLMLERFSETKKRQSGESTCTTPRKRRNNGTETFSILERKIELDQEFRKEEMMRRKEEEERRKQEEKERNLRFEFLQQQQNQHQQQMQQQQQQMQHLVLQQQQFMQQQAQQTQTIMMALLKSLEKKD
ncbi:golgin subfamily A member 6-like protein 7 [Patiria miniata]|uniref:Uncharacterized protein n=1 Tax=Patiria miniata TaxID=46514 RepID=A0A914AFU6_PATMI|nr:golgin subfamily A member 6-like protein 7 [Patiria miniata]